MTISLHATKNWPYQVGAGGAVYRQKEGGGREYAVLIRRDYILDKKPETYNLPKGRVDGAETLEMTAIREIEEEAGCLVELKAYLGALHHSYELQQIEMHIDRAVHYYLAEYKASSENDMDDEHDEVVWLSASAAKKHLKEQVKQEQEIIDRAEAWFEAHENDTAK